MILVWYKDTKIIDDIKIMFVPIIGWKYDDWSHQYGKLTPITPPWYRIKDRLEKKDGEVRMSYYVRDGVECEISSEWTTGDGNFWGNLYEWSYQDKVISFGHIPDSLKNKVQKMIEHKQISKVQDETL